MLIHPQGQQWRAWRSHDTMSSDKRGLVQQAMQPEMVALRAFNHLHWQPS